MTSTYTSPDPVDSFYLPGVWMMQIEYGNMSSNDVFTILESDTILLPSWFKDLVVLWNGDVISDVGFGEFSICSCIMGLKAKFCDSPVRLQTGQRRRCKNLSNSCGS